MTAINLWLLIYHEKHLLIGIAITAVAGISALAINLSIYTAGTQLVLLIVSVLVFIIKNKLIVEKRIRENMVNENLIKEKNKVVKLENIKNRITNLEQGIRKVLKFYGVTRELAGIVEFDDMITHLEHSVKLCLPVTKKVMFFLTSPELNKVEFVGAGSSGDANSEYDNELALRAIHNRKLEIAGETGMIAVPLVLMSEVIGGFIIRVPNDTELTSPVLLLDIEILANQLSLGVEKARLYSQVQRISRTDGLTGLHRRHYFFDRMEEEIVRAKKYATNFAVVVIDIDHFKKVNDTHGHQVGDEILRGIAEIIRECIYETDMAGRFGGEEFMILLRRADDPAGVFRKMEWLRNCVERKMFGNIMEPLRVTISIGIAFYPRDDQTGRKVWQLADQALLHSKNTGRNRTTDYLTIKNVID